MCNHLVILQSPPTKNLNKSCIFFTILSDNSKLNGSGLTLTIKFQTVNKLESLMVKIQKHACILLYGGTILKQISWKYVSCSINYQQTQEDKCQTVNHITSLLLPNRNCLLMTNPNYICMESALLFLLHVDISCS